MRSSPQLVNECRFLKGLQCSFDHRFYILSSGFWSKTFWIALSAACRFIPNAIKAFNASVPTVLPFQGEIFASIRLFGKLISKFQHNAFGCFPTYSFYSFQHFSIALGNGTADFIGLHIRQHDAGCGGANARYT